MSESTLELSIKNSDFQFEERRGRPKAENPFGDYIQNSWGQRQKNDAVGSSMEVILKNDAECGKNGQPKNVVQTLGQIRQAAALQNLGARIELRPAIKRGKKIVSVDADEDGRYNANNTTYTIIYFAAKARTKRPRKDSENEDRGPSVT